MVQHALRTCVWHFDTFLCCSLADMQQRDMSLTNVLHSQRTATHSVSSFLILFVPSSKSKLERWNDGEFQVVFPPTQQKQTKKPPKTKVKFYSNLVDKVKGHASVKTQTLQNQIREKIGNLEKMPVNSVYDFLNCNFRSKNLKFTSAVISFPLISSPLDIGCGFFEHNPADRDSVEYVLHKQGKKKKKKQRLKK